MLVSSFMIPANKVVTCSADATIEKVMTQVLEKKISAVVVVDAAKKPCGIVTKTDFVSAYHKGVDLHQSVSLIMNTKLDTVLDTDDKDKAAKLFEKQRHHHAIVVNKSYEFVGLISAWDIAAECARDSRAWPWTRTEDGRIHQPAHQRSR